MTIAHEHVYCTVIKKDNIKNNEWAPKIMAPVYFLFSFTPWGKLLVIRILRHGSFLPQQCDLVNQKNSEKNLAPKFPSLNYDVDMTHFYRFD